MISKKINNINRQIDEHIIMAAPRNEGVGCDLIYPVLFDFEKQIGNAEKCVNNIDVGGNNNRDVLDCCYRSIIDRKFPVSKIIANEKIYIGQKKEQILFEAERLAKEKYNETESGHSAISKFLKDKNILTDADLVRQAKNMRDVFGCRLSEQFRKYSRQGVSGEGHNVMDNFYNKLKQLENS